MLITTTSVRLVLLIPTVLVQMPTVVATVHLEQTPNNKLFKYLRLLVVSTKSLGFHCSIYYKGCNLKPLKFEHGIHVVAYTSRILNSNVNFSLVCPSGSFLNSNKANACEMCPVNTYSTGTNANSCTNCPSGTNTQQQNGQSTQTACGK